MDLPVRIVSKAEFVLRYENPEVSLVGQKERGTMNVPLCGVKL
jgi:hypothetical protein